MCWGGSLVLSHCYPSTFTQAYALQGTLGLKPGGGGVHALQGTKIGTETRGGVHGEEW